MSVREEPRFSLIQLFVLAVIIGALSILFYRITEPKDVSSTDLNVTEFELLEVYMDNGSKQYFLGESDSKTKRTFWYSNPIRTVHSCTEKNINKYFKTTE